MTYQAWRRMLGIHLLWEQICDHAVVTSEDKDLMDQISESKGHPWLSRRLLKLPVRERTRRLNWALGQHRERVRCREKIQNLTLDLWSQRKCKHVQTKTVTSQSSVTSTGGWPATWCDNVQWLTTTCHWLPFCRFPMADRLAALSNNFPLLTQPPH